MLEFTDEELQAAAERHGMVDPGQSTPQYLRSKVAAVLLNERCAADVKAKAKEPAAPQSAREIVLQPGGQILVDGRPFPWLVADERIEVSLHPDPGGISTVRMTLLAESVQIIKPNENESENNS